MSVRSEGALARKILEDRSWPAALPQHPDEPGRRKSSERTRSGRTGEPSIVLPAGLHRGWQPEAVPGAWGLARLCGRLVELSGGLASAALTTAVGLVREAQLEGEPTAWITEKESAFFPPDVRDSGVDLEALAVVRLEVLSEGPRAADLLLRSGGFGLVVVDLGSGGAPDRTPGSARARPGIRTTGRAARGSGRSWTNTAVQARLAGLAQKHRAALVLLTSGPPWFERRPPGSRGSSFLGPMVSLRVEASRSPATRDRAAGRSVKSGIAGIAGDVGGAGKPEEAEGFADPGDRGGDPDQDRVEIIVHVLKDKRGGLSRPHQEVCRGPDGLR